MPLVRIACVAAGLALLANSVAASAYTTASQTVPCSTNGPIAFVTDNAASGASDIAVVRPDGRALRSITATGDAWSPSWSPDGTRLLFEDHVDGDGDIYVTERDGTNVVNLTADSAADESSPEWSPTGRWIAFASDRADDDGGASEIYKMKPDGSRVTRLTNNRVQDWTPTWSPNGRRIAFVRITNVEHIFVMRSDGSDVRNITGEEDGANPEWSPDGRRIAFQGLDAQGGEVDIYTVRPNGAGVKRLTRSPRNEQNPSWSSNGRRLAFTRSWKLFTMRRDGSGVRSVSTGSGDVYAPSWGPRLCNSA